MYYNEMVIWSILYAATVLANINQFHALEVTLVNCALQKNFALTVNEQETIEKFDKQYCMLTL